MKKLLLPISISAALLAGCSDDATIASHNLSKAADNFEVPRRIVFYNGITGEYMLSIEGLCSQEPLQRRVAIICKDGHQYKKHYLGLSDNVTYFSEQMEATDASAKQYRVTFKPSQIIRQVNLR